jgi:predicted PurR-regulated permease PerM
MPPHASPPITRRDLALALLVVLLAVVAWTLRGIVLLVAFALLLAYILDPLVSALERVPLPARRRVPRIVATIVVMAVLVIALGVVAAIGVPVLARQLFAFVGRLPAQIENLLDDLRAQAAATPWGANLQPGIDTLHVNLRTLFPQVAGLIARALAGLFARFDQVVGLAVLPVLAFYLLVERERVRDSMLRFLPEDTRESVGALAGPLHRALQSYVRGQALVCLTMGIAIGTGLTIAGIPNSVLLGVLAGVGEIIPFLGATLAAIAIVLSGLTLDSLHAVIGLSLYLAINWMLGAFVTPRVMARYLELHPFVVIVSVLAGARLLGPPGAIIALPAAAMIQALIEEVTARRARVRPTSI